MRLREYALSFTHFPWLQPTRPFEGWGSTGAPTHELPWYSAYNAVKHDREATFPQATLLHALTAIAGCAVLLCAQVGVQKAFRRGSGVDGFFCLTDRPAWDYPQVYTLDYDGWTKTAHRYAF